MIAQLVMQLIAAGTPPELAAQVVSDAFEIGARCNQSADIRRQSDDETTLKRRAYDRERMRKIRRQSADSPPTPPTSDDTTLTLKKDKNKKVRATKHPCPPTWQPSEAHFAAAAKMNIPRSAVEAKAEDMRIWAGSTGALKVDWDLTFHGFLRRDAPKLAVNGHAKTVDMPGFYAEFNSAQLAAWEAYERDGGTKYPRDRKGGWRFPTEWPPGHPSAT